jgi:DNA-binding CsgD family transcriptional regulator
MQLRFDHRGMPEGAGTHEAIVRAGGPRRRRAQGLARHTANSPVFRSATANAFDARAELCSGSRRPTKRRALRRLVYRIPVPWSTRGLGTSRRVPRRSAFVPGSPRISYRSTFSNGAGLSVGWAAEVSRGRDMVGDIATQVLPLLELLYGADFTADGWVHFLRMLMGVVESDVSIAVLWDRQGRPLEFLSEGIFSRDMMGVYEAHFAAIDPWADAFLSAGRPFGKNVCSHEVLDPKVFEQTEYYNDFWRPNSDLFHTCGALIAIEGGYANVGMPRCRSRGEYDARTIALLDMLSPHIGNALNLHQRLKHANTARANAEAALGQLEDAMLIVDGSGLILYANAAAESELANGQRLSSLRGRLGAGSQVDKGEFEKALSTAATLSDLAATSAPASIASRELLPSLRASISFHALPSRRGSSLDAPRAAVLVMVCQSTDKEARMASLLRALYGLTPAEARIAQELVRGRNLEEIAAALAMTKGTIRVHLKHIFLKTGMNRQGQLISLLQRVQPRLRGALG